MTIGGNALGNYFIPPEHQVLLSTSFLCHSALAAIC